MAEDGTRFPKPEPGDQQNQRRHQEKDFGGREMPGYVPRGECSRDGHGDGHGLPEGAEAARHQFFLGDEGDQSLIGRHEEPGK